MNLRENKRCKAPGCDCPGAECIGQCLNWSYAPDFLTDAEERRIDHSLTAAMVCLAAMLVIICIGASVWLFRALFDFFAKF